MQTTPFPIRPSEVVALTVQEFTSELALNGAAPAIDRVCRRFLDDENRALVWFIRFRALEAWCARPGMTAWMLSCAEHTAHACELAASFTLNDDWEFEVEDFRSAVEAASRDGRGGWRGRGH